jgi:hypothetical protein
MSSTFTRWGLQRDGKWKRRASVAVGFTLAMSLVLGAGRAAATVIEQHHYSDSISFTLDECGFTLEGQVEASGHLLLRVEQGGQLFLAKDTFSFRTVLTNPDTGKWFVLRGKGVYHDIKGTQVSGSVYEVVAIEAGQPFAIEDSAGNVILRDRGVGRTTYLFDTLGDGVPGGETIAVIDVVFRGPHPSFDEDFCEIAAELTGA